MPIRLPYFHLNMNLYPNQPEKNIATKIKMVGSTDMQGGERGMNLRVEIGGFILTKIKGMPLERYGFLKICN